MAACIWLEQLEAMFVIGLGSARQVAPLEFKAGVMKIWTEMVPEDWRGRQ
jgi:hypothetical protein